MSFGILHFMPLPTALIHNFNFEVILKYRPDFRGLWTCMGCGLEPMSDTERSGARNMMSWTRPEDTRAWANCSKVKNDVRRKENACPSPEPSSLRFRVSGNALRACGFALGARSRFLGFGGEFIRRLRVHLEDISWAIHDAPPMYVVSLKNKDFLDKDNRHLNTHLCPDSYPLLVLVLLFLSLLRETSRTRTLRLRS